MTDLKIYRDEIVKKHNEMQKQFVVDYVAKLSENIRQKCYKLEQARGYEEFCKKSKISHFRNLIEETTKFYKNSLKEQRHEIEELTDVKTELFKELDQKRLEFAKLEKENTSYRTKLSNLQKNKNEALAFKTISSVLFVHCDKTNISGLVTKDKVTPFKFETQKDKKEITNSIWKCMEKSNEEDCRKIMEKLNNTVKKKENE